MKLLLFSIFLLIHKSIVYVFVTNKGKEKQLLTTKISRNLLTTAANESATPNTLKYSPSTKTTSNTIDNYGCNRNTKQL